MRDDVIVESVVGIFLAFLRLRNPLEDQSIGSLVSVSFFSNVFVHMIGFIS